MERFFLITGLTILLFSCSPAQKQKEQYAGKEYTAIHYYECNSSLSFTAAFTADSVRVILPDEELLLPHVVSASGAKYQNDEALLWNKGNEALFEYENYSFSNCTNNSIEATWQKAKLAGVDFRGVGQEPGWILEIRNNKHIQFAYNYGQDTVYTPVPKTALQDSLNFSVKTEAHQLNIEITKEPCTDTMNGSSYPNSVAVTLDGEQFMGCGKFL